MSHAPNSRPSPAKSKARAQLDRQGWIDAALKVLADQGVSGVRVESLAKAFGVTKGSFYWHFKDRSDLLEAMLHTWQEGRILDIKKQTDAETNTEPALATIDISEKTQAKAREQLRHVINLYSANRNRQGIAIELAVRAWARHDTQAARVVEEVDNCRLQCTQKLFLANGLSESEAKSRSLLLYAYVFGQSLMSYDRYDLKINEFKRWIVEHIVTP
ncbi:MAG: TetR family transcriptional regulator [Pseudomonadota bacterium]